MVSIFKDIPAFIGISSTAAKDKVRNNFPELLEQSAVT
jgi:hypothetical protein